MPDGMGVANTSSRQIALTKALIKVAPPGARREWCGAYQEMAIRLFELRIPFSMEQAGTLLAQRYWNGGVVAASRGRTTEAHSVTSSRSRNLQGVHSFSANPAEALDVASRHNSLIPFATDPLLRTSILAGSLGRSHRIRIQRRECILTHP